MPFEGLLSMFRRSNESNTNTNEADEHTPEPSNSKALEEVVKLNLQDVEQQLRKFGLNVHDYSPGTLYRRLWLFRALGDDACCFDLGHLEVTQSKLDEWFNEATSRKFMLRSLDVGEIPHKEAHSTYKIFLVMHDFMEAHTEDSIRHIPYQQQLKNCISWIQTMICDFRPVSQRQSNAAIRIEKRSTDALGYTREDLLNLSFSELMAIMKKDIPLRGVLYRAEYEENEAHLRSNMKLLIQRVKRHIRYQDKMEAKQSKESLPPQAKLEDTINWLKKLTPMELCDWETKLNLRPDDTLYSGNSDTARRGGYALFQYNSILNRLEKFATNEYEQASRARISIADIHNTLPSLIHGVPQTQVISGSAAYVDPLVVLCKTSTIGDFAEIREIGIRCDHVFACGSVLADILAKEEFDNSGMQDPNLSWRDRVPEQTYHLEAYTPEEGLENCQTIENILYTHTTKGQAIQTLYMPLPIPDRADHVLFQFDVQNGVLVSSHPKWLTIPCMPIHVAADNGKIFKRFLMLISYRSEKSKMIAERLHNSEHKFQETGSTITQILKHYETYEGRVHNTSLSSEDDAPTTTIRFNMGSQLRQIVFHELEDSVMHEWKSKIGDPTKHDVVPQREAKEMMLDLIMAGKGGKYCAIVTESHLQYIAIIVDNCKLALAEMMIESSNFRVLMRKLHELNKSNLSICVLRVTGKLSGTDISLLVDSANGSSYRLLILYYPQLISSLNVTRKNTSVIIPASVLSDKQFSTRAYDHTTPLLQSFSNYEWNPETFNLMKAARTKLIEPFVQKNLQGLSWKKQEQEWRSMPYTAGTFLEHNFFRIIVTPDVEIVRRYYKATSVRIVDPLDRIDLEGNVDNYLSMFSTVEIEGKERGCLVVMNSHLLSEARKQFVVSRCAAVKVRLAFVVDLYNPEDKVVKVISTNQVSRLIEGQLYFPLPDTHDCQALVRDGTQEATLVYRTLRLLLGPLIPVSSITAIKAALPLVAGQSDKIPTSVLDFLKEVALHESSIPLVVLERAWNAVLKAIRVKTENAQELLELVCILCVRYVQQNEDLANDIPFALYTTDVAVCQFVPQHVRVEMWIRQILLPSKGYSLPKGWIIKQFSHGYINIHSRHLLAFFCVINDARQSIETPSYTFMKKGPSIGEQELLLQQCMQGQELEWTRLNEMLRFFPFGLDFLMTLLEAYQQPLKILSAISPQSLFNLMENATTAKFGVVLEKLVQQLSTSANPLMSELLRLPTPVFSVLKWSLRSNAKLQANIQFDKADVEAMVSCHVPLSLLSQSSKFVKHLLPLILGLDGPLDIIYQQVGLRQFFLYIEQSVVDSILGKGYAIGKSVLDLIFNNSIRNELVYHRSLSDTNQTEQAKFLFLKHPYCMKLVEWLEEGVSLEACQPLIDRFTTEALAYLVASCAINGHSKHLWDAIAKTIDTRVPQDERKKFLSSIFATATGHTHSRSQMVLVLEFASANFGAIDCSDKFYDVISRCVADKNLAELEEVARSQAGEYIPIEVSEHIKHLYIRRLSDDAIKFPELTGADIDHIVQSHCKSVSPQSYEVLARELCFSNSNASKARFLTFLSWLLHPFYQLPFYPVGEEVRCFEELKNHPKINLYDTVRSNINNISNLALFLTAPQYLDLELCNFFARALQKDVEQIKEHAYVVCQYKHPKLPPYTLRVPVRPLPQEQLETWLRSTVDIDVWKSRKKSPHLTFDVSSGVDEELLATNLSALANLGKVIFEQNASEDANTRNPNYIAHVLLAWFVAMGIPVHAVKQWLENCITEHFRDQPEAQKQGEYPDVISNLKVLNSFFEYLKTTNLTYTEPTWYPIPSFVDVRLKALTAEMDLFGTSSEEILFTFQFFTSYLAIIPKPPVSMDSVVQTGTFGTSDRPTILDDYYKLPSISAKALGNFVADQIENSFPSATQLEDMCSGFCKKLNSVLRQRIHNNTAHLGIAKDMMLSFLSGLSRFRDNEEYQARISRCLVSRISLSRSDSSHQLIDQLLQSFRQTNFHLCLHTRDELIFMNDRGFANLPTLSHFNSNSTCFTIPLSTSEGNLLTFSVLQRFDTLQNSRPPLVATSSTSSTDEIYAYSVSVDNTLYQNPAAPLFEQQRIAYTEGSISKNECNIDDEFCFSHKKRVLYTESTIYCHSLLHLAKHNDYATLQVKPGMAGFLVQHPADSSLFCFASAEEWKQLCDSNLETSNPKLFKGEVAASYSNFGEAWDMISSSCPPLTLLALDGLFLKKSPSGNTWIPAIIGYSTTIPDFNQSKNEAIESEISIWNILDLHRFLSYKMDKNVVGLLRFLCECIWKEYTGKFRTKWALESLLHNFRQLDVPANGYEANEHRKAERLKVKQIANMLRDIVLEILKYVSPDKITPSAKIIKQLLGNKFPHIRQEELEKHLLKSVAYVNQINDILCSQYGLEVFFGTKAVAENNTLVNQVIPQKPTEEEEYYEWSDKIFEDESGTSLACSTVSQQLKGNKPIFGSIGYGDPMSNANQVLSLFGPHPPLYYYFLDKIVHKPKYSTEGGCVLAYLLNDTLFKFTSTMKEKMAEWFLNVLRSPLADHLKEWFLNMSCQRLGAPPPIHDRVRDALVPSSVIISSCIARSCPHPVLQESLKNVCRLPKSIEPFCQRRDNKYGVFFCGTSTLRAMREVGLWVEVVDLGAAKATGIATIDEFYLQIIGAFSPFTCFVYIQGLPAIEDLFLKWCCEYTQRCPWRFIFFENTDSSHNFSENRDRCNDTFYWHPSLEEWLLNQYGANTEICTVTYRQHHHGGTCETLLKEYLPEVDTSIITSRYISDWEDQIEDIRQKQKIFVVFVESPPGAGKTHLMEQIIEEETKSNCKCVRVDCSNDELVERAMESVLSSHFPDDAPSSSESILIADEFHMLSEEHKTQFVKWVSTRLTWLRIFIIANRSSDFDDTLLEQLRLKQVFVCKMVCRLEVSKILRLHQHTNEKINIFMDMWHTATRALFGDESISLRHASKLKEVMQNTNTLPNLALATFFRSKMPSLGSYMCEQFTNCLLYFYNLKCKGSLKLPPDTPFSSPIHLLVETALITSSKNIASYPEFIRTLKGSMKAHPLLRLAAWVKRVHRELAFAVPPLDCLMQLKLIDQIGFPLVIGIGSNSSVRSCDTFSQRGNYNNLKWMHDTLTHGYAINWDEVKGCWKSHFITNSTQFEDLLSVCPNPASCIQAVDPKNLSVLIESGSHRLAQMVIEFYETNNHQFQRELTQADSPYYSAAWFLLRQQEFPLSLHPLRQLNIDELKVLLWASRFGFHALSVKDKHKERTEFLQQTLIRCTSDLVRKIDQLKADPTQMKQTADLENHIVTLWSHVFSPLLRVGTKQGGVPHAVTLLLAAHQFPPKSDWPTLVKYLSLVLHNKAEKREVEYLLASDLFYRLNERSEFDLDHNFTLPTGPLGIRFVTGLMTVGPPGSILSKKWQIHLLTTDNVVIPDHFCTPKGLLQLEQGVATLRDPSHIKIAPGKVRTSLEASRVFAKRESAFVADHHKQVSMAERKQLKYNMRFLRNITTKEEILKYYNIYVGVKWTDIEVSETEKFKMDEYNNPKGDKFDLGKTGAFGEFRILIGNFFQRGEFSSSLFKRFAQAALERKGFHVTMVNDEEAFIRNLPQYDLAWLISSDALDWNVRSNTIEVTKWRRLADACQQFYLSGRGLFIFADNAPFLDHASVVLERLFNVKLEGNTPAKRVLEIAKVDPPARGTFSSAHLIGSGLRTLFEGDTVSYPVGKLPKELQVFAQSTDNHPVIFCGENDVGGRIVVDTGFTKLWVEWNSAGTDRYVCNATVWLLALERRLEKGYPIRGPVVAPNIPIGITPAVAPTEAKSGKADIVLVVDGSGSVDQIQFAEMKAFSQKLATSLVKPNIVRFGVVQFATTAQIECAMSYSQSEILQSIQAMNQLCSGTVFDIGLEYAEKLLNNGDTRASKIIIFQTDGEGHTRSATSLRRNGITIFAIGVGNGVNQSNLILLAGDVNNTLHCTSYNQLPTLLQKIVGDVAKSTS